MASFGRLIRRVLPRRSRLKQIGWFVVKLGIWCVILTALVGAVGFAYVWYSGQQEVPAASSPPVASVPTRPTIERPKPNPKAPVSASIQMLTSPVHPGSNATLTVRTTPKATCTVSVEYDNDVKSIATGLKSAKADEFGMVSWEWTVEPAAPRGTWPVEATCTAYKKSAMVRGGLEVK